MRGLQRLAEHLPTEHLRRTRIAAFAAKQVELQALQLELPLQISQASVHRGRRHQNLSVPFMIDEWPGKLQKKVYAPPLVSLEVGNVTVSL